MKNRHEMFERLDTYLESADIRTFRDEILELNEVDISEYIEGIPDDKALIVFRTLPKDIASEVFANFEIEMQEKLIAEMTDQELVSVLDEMFVDDVVDMLEELPAGVVKRVLKNTDPKVRGTINNFLNYPRDSAGTLMTAEFTNIRANMTVGEAVGYIRKKGEDSDTLYNCYVIDKNRVLNGMVPLKTLLLSQDEEKVSDLMDNVPVKVSTNDDKEYVAQVFAKYDYLSIPVVDSEDRLVGVITVDDILDVLEEETTEDFERMAATIPSGKPYLKTPSWLLAKNRIVWLSVLMISGIVSSMILERYENAIAAVPLLVAFIPMLTDTGGNAGAQSSTLIIRSMILNEVETRDALKVLWKEMQVSVMAGSALAGMNYVRMRIQFPGQETVVLVVTLSLIATVIIAKVVGGMLPIGAKFLNMDPTIMAAPLITTVVDALALIIYFALAANMLSISM